MANIAKKTGDHDRSGHPSMTPSTNGKSSNSKLLHSGKDTPCPICERTKDADCSWSPDLSMVLCHTNATNPPRSIGGYEFVKLTSSGIHGPNSAAMYAKQAQEKPVRSAKRSEYIYHTSDGSPLAKVVRIDAGTGAKKRIFQQHYLKGEWFNGLSKPYQKQVRLYRIDDPINQSAITNGEPLLMVEGEGKVELLHALGIAATCNIGGAGKWKAYGYPDYLKQLEGANLVIVPDRDRPGVDHANTIAEDFPNAQWLYPFPDSPLWDNLPAKDGLDIADWIADYKLAKDEVLATIGKRRQPIADITPSEIPSEFRSKTQREYERIQENFGHRLRYNTLTRKVELDGQALSLTRAKIELNVNHRVSLTSARDEIAEMCLMIAEKNSYSPVAEYLGQVVKQYSDTAILDIADWIADYKLAKDEVLATIGDKRSPVEQKETTATTEPIIQAQFKPKLLQDYELLESVLGERLRFNFLSKQVELDGEVFDPLATKIELAIRYNLELRSSKEDSCDLLVRLAKRNTYSPVAEYLEAVAKHHGATTTILDGLAERYLGTTKPLHQTMLIRFLVGAVARALEPGCKNDVALILFGKQGIGKSSFLKTLASNAWFDDSMGSASTDRDERIKMHLVWIVEWAELETVFRRKAVSQVKAFMSCSTDRLRPPYGRTFEVLQRASVLSGSTNEPEFLTDASGDRRFWVIPVTKQVNIARLKQERDQIWAAAVKLYRDGQIWHLEPGEEEQATEDRAVYRDQDPWHLAIEAYCSMRSMVSTAEILTEVIKLDLAKQTQLDKRRVTKVLSLLGWEHAKNPRSYQGLRQRVWIDPSLDDNTVQTVSKSQEWPPASITDGTVYDTVF